MARANKLIDRGSRMSYLTPLISLRGQTAEDDNYFGIHIKLILKPRYSTVHFLKRVCFWVMPVNLLKV